MTRRERDAGNFYATQPPRWPVLVYCMAVATAASLFSARFANRVENRTVGLLTGVILTAMGVMLIVLHYW